MVFHFVFDDAGIRRFIAIFKRICSTTLARAIFEVRNEQLCHDLQAAAAAVFCMIMLAPFLSFDQIDESSALEISSHTKNQEDLLSLQTICTLNWLTLPFL